MLRSALSIYFESQDTRVRTARLLAGSAGREVDMRSNAGKNREARDWNSTLVIIKEFATPIFQESLSRKDGVAFCRKRCPKAKIDPSLELLHPIPDT